MGILALLFLGCLVTSQTLALADPQYPGDPCDPISEPCTDVGQTECVPADGGGFFCRCNDGLITDLEGRRCIAVPTKPGDACSDDVANCGLIPNTECRDAGVGPSCLCVDDFIQLADRCMAPPTHPGQECDREAVPCTGVVDTLCDINLESGGYYCKCTGELVTDVVGEVCLVKPLKPGDLCHASLTPCTDIPFTSCSVGSEGSTVCVCNPGFVTDYANSQCLKIPAQPGDTCSPSINECTAVANTQCNTDGDDYYCQCIGEWVTDRPNRKCLKKPAQPGDQCHPELTPCDEIDFTDCLENEQGTYTCACTGDYVNHPNGRCLLKPTLPAQECLPLAASCLNVENTECVLANEIYICMCNYPLLTDLPNNRCIEHPMYPGDACEMVEDPCKLVSNSTCVDDGVLPLSYCKCSDAFYTDFPGKRCIEFPTKPGQRCEPPYTDCARVIADPTPSTCAEADSNDYFYCRCEGDYMTDVNNTLCLKIPTNPGDSCDPSLTPCKDISNTTCTEADGSYLCTCDTPLVYIGAKCIASPKLPAHECHPDLAPCTGILDTTCKPQGPIYTCQCDGSLITDPDHNICLSKPNLPGDRCHLNLATCEDVQRTICSEVVPDIYRCMCTDDLVTDPVNQVCLEPPQLPGDSCNPVLTPCTNVTLTECKPDGNGGYFCKCNEGYITADQKCIRIPTSPGDECHPMLAPCDSITGTTCTINEEVTSFFCKCDGDLINWADKCLKAPERPGDLCSPNIPCTDIKNTTCETDSEEDYYCKCSVLEYFTDFQERDCIPHPIALEDYCDGNSTRPCTAMPYAECLPSEDGRLTCQCPALYFDDMGNCIILPSKPHDRCLTQEHCEVIPNSECRQSSPGSGYPACYCIPGYDLNEDGLSCIPRATEVGRPCQSETQCLDLSNTFCSIDDFGQGYCLCIEDTIPSTSRQFCLPVVYNLTGDCSESLQCTSGLGNYTICDRDSGTCDCLDGYVQSIDLRRCLEVVGIAEKCEEAQQCTESLGSYAVCHEFGMCACGIGSQFLDYFCYRQAPLHSLCTVTEECIVGTNNNTYCNSASATCQCFREAIEFENSCYGDLSIGSSCSTDMECSIPIHGGECNRRNRTCSCAYDEFPLNEQRCSGGSKNGAIYIAYCLTLFLGILLNSYT